MRLNPDGNRSRPMFQLFAMKDLSAMGKIVHRFQSLACMQDIILHNNITQCW